MDLAGGDGQVEPVERPDVAEGLDESGDVDGRHASSLTLGAAPPQHPLIAAAQRDALGVEVLEEGLGVLARGAELVAQRPRA